MAKTPIMPPAEAPAATGLPDWYDDRHHAAGDGGIYHAATGVLLGEDGEPASAALRLQRELAAMAIETLPPAAPAADTNTPVQE